jgi:hypothetical protein
MNNYDYKWVCIYFYYNTHKCEECNIINNSQGTNRYGTILCTATTLTVNKCCMIENNVIGSGIYLFYAFWGTIEVRECSIQSGFEMSSTLTGSITTSYSNSVAESTCSKIENCGTKTNNNQQKLKCSDFKVVMLNNQKILILIFEICH